MRVLLAAAVTGLLAASVASGEEKPGGAVERRLALPELTAAVEGSVTCEDADATGACENVVSIAIEGDTLRLRDVGVIAITDLTVPWFQRLQTVQDHTTLFSDLAEQRAEGDYAYVKLLETVTRRFDVQRGAWCQVDQVDYGLGELTFYFSNVLTPTLDSDTPFSSRSTEGTRAFLRDLFSDPEVRARAARDEEMEFILQGLTGQTRFCVTYYGTGPADRPSVTRVEYRTLEGRRVPSMDDRITMHSIDAHLTLQP